MNLPLHLQHLQHLQGDDLKAAVQQEYYTQAIAFICRQTDYTEATAVERLNALKDPVKVVKEYLGQSDEPDTAVAKSKNQIKYGEIRKLMDAGAKQYSAQKELNERRKQYQEYVESQQSHQQSP
jgi:hypothetical protein